ncbi:MAG: molecular chaperone DnaJ [Alphaproteobacteria bacterium]|nr:molecular chaperone DnaJ [Alphaproteobacteria bacterium]
MRTNRFHGRFEARDKTCDWPGCDEPGEFRAPGARPPGFDGPGEWRWFCLDHVRKFNASYDYFDGMSPDEILRAQSPIHSWERESRAFNPAAGVDGMPRWADFADPLDAIGSRARASRQRAESASRAQPRADGQPVSWEERRALEVLGLSLDADRRAVRRRYTEMLRRYHPDHNGGDRRHEVRLQGVVEAWQVLRKAAIFR